MFEEFLGQSFLLIKDETCQGIFKISTDDFETEIILPNILLGKSNNVLDASFIPLLPLRIRNLSDIQSRDSLFSNTIPVLFGRETFVLWNARQIKSEICIDILGSIFFCLTRLEEYKSKALDDFDRYQYKESILFKANIHERAIVNEYLEILWSLLIQKYPVLKRKVRTYKVKLSHDVDIPQSLDFNLSRLFKNIIADIVIRKSPRLVLQRLKGKLTSGVKKYDYDPNNNFDFIMDISEKMGLKSHFNFITVDGKGNIDGSYDIDTPFFHNLLKKINNRGHVIGLHPSYFSFDNKAMIQEQFVKLKNICEKNGITQSLWGGRHHFLRWKNPITWQIWEDVGLNYDSSVGFGNILGFRSGTCYPYSTYNLETRQHLKLIEYPLIYMDVNAFANSKFTEQELSKKLADTVRFFNGEFTFLYHNNYIISTTEKVKYIELLKIISE